ncbi:MAG: hypothetical protein HY461_01170 [Parcubacteria group bacterium]|nr:hypothetical protein [Parcubacteria group bacterium]
MPSFACVLPHSPLLLTQGKGVMRVSHPQTQAAFAAMARDIEQQEIKTIISIAAHARYERDGFSLSIQRELAIDFSPFGDLASKLELKPHWPLYHRLREKSLASPLVLHPLDDDRLDYGHGIPLWLLYQNWPGLEHCRVLAVNDHDQMSNEQRLQLGKLLAESIAIETDPVAIICSGDLHTTHPGELPWETVKEKNEALRRSITQLFAAGGDEAKDLPTTTCISGPAMILRGLQKENRHLPLVEQSFEHANPTSFLCLSWKS